MQVSVTVSICNLLMLSYMLAVFQPWVHFQLVRPVIRSRFETFPPSEGVVTCVARCQRKRLKVPVEFVVF